MEKTFLAVLILSIVLVGLSFLGIAIKIWLKKEGKFAGTCASQSPFLNKEGEVCGYCGKLPENCENKEIEKKNFD